MDCWPMAQREVFQRILSRYKKAWEKRDPELAVELFTRDASYLEGPFDSRPMKGLREIRDYWAMVPRFQKKIRFSYGPVFRLDRSSVWGTEWSASYTKVKTGERIRLKGVLFCELRDGKVRRFWEYWHVRGGASSFRAQGLRRE